MEFVPIILFAVLLVAGGGLFAYHMRKIRRNILLGREREPVGTTAERWNTMLKVAIGQNKMVKRRTFAGIFHVMIYVGFLAINIEVIEIVIDGLTGQHRFVGQHLGFGYGIVIAVAEVFMALVFISCVVFLIRRRLGHIPRFEKPEMKGWPKVDADIILWTEIGLVLALWIMNGADQVLQMRDAPHYVEAGIFPISSLATEFLSGIESNDTLILIERSAWWAHIIGIFAFLNYIPFSKHLHIFLSFPNTYYTEKRPEGEFDVDMNIKKEVELMMNPDAPMPEEEEDETPARFGAKDVFDLKWTNLLGAYTCTECGRCTAACPANITGKKLSPRKIMMDTRDRLHEVGRNIDENNGEFQDDGKSLHDRITAEELWACTTCNACVEACPVNINPLDIINQMRQYLVLEESSAPEAVNAMFMNVENNQAPWAMPAGDRFNWAQDVSIGSNGNGQDEQAQANGESGVADDDASPN